MANKPAGNSKGSPPSKEAKATSSELAPIMTEQDKRMDEEHIKLVEHFKKLEILYKPLSFKPIHYLRQLKEYIIGQDKALDSLVYVVYHNLHENMISDYNEHNSKRLSAIVIGPSGCGKTASLTKLSKLFGVPFVKYNATPLTSGGFVGKDVEAMLQLLIEAAHGDIELAERGILYIDEIDKKVSSHANNTSGRDINGTAVQEELLKFLEPSIIDLGNGKTFDVSHLTVLMSGRFVDIDKIRKKRLNGTSKMGFTNEGYAFSEIVSLNPEEDDFNEFDDSKSTSYTHQDIINFGFLDEFVGRIYDVIEFRQLSREDLIDVILAKGSTLQNFVEAIHLKNQELIIDPAIFERMAEAAFNSPMGARCLESIVTKFLKPADEDFMENYRPGIMEFDADGNYFSVFEPIAGGEPVYKFIEGPRAKRRRELYKEQQERDSKKQSENSKAPVLVVPKRAKQASGG